MSNRESESAGSVNEDVPHQNARVRGRDEARENGIVKRGGSACGMRVDMCE